MSALSPEFLFAFDWFISFPGHVLVLFLTFSELISPYFGWKMEMSHGFDYSFMKFSKFKLLWYLLTDQHMDVNALWNYVPQPAQVLMLQDTGWKWCWWTSFADQNDLYFCSTTTHTPPTLLVSCPQIIIKSHNKKFQWRRRSCWTNSKELSVVLVLEVFLPILQSWNLVRHYYKSCKWYNKRTENLRQRELKLFFFGFHA